MTTESFSCALFNHHIQAIWAVFASFNTIPAFCRSFCLFLDTLRPCRRQKLPSDHVQVRQGKEHEGEVRVLRQALVSDLRKAEDPLRYEEDVLPTASRFRAQAVSFPLFFGELLVFRSSRLGQVQRPGRLFRDLLRLAHVGRVAEDDTLFTVKDVLYHP